MVHIDGADAVLQQPGTKPSAVLITGGTNEFLINSLCTFKADVHEDGHDYISSLPW